MDLSVPPTRTVRWWAIVYAVAITPVDFDRIGLANAGGPDMIKWLLRGPVWFLPLVLLVPRWGTFLQALRRPPTTWLMAWAILGPVSVAWAFVPTQAVLVGSAIASLVVLSTWYVFTNGWHTFATATSVGLTIFIVLGILVDFLDSTLIGARSAGLASGPTGLGRLAAFNIVLAAGIIWSGRSTQLFWAVPMLSTAALILSETRTAMAAAIVGLLYGGLRRLSRLNQLLTICAIAIGLVALLAGLAAVSEGVASLGDRGDPTSVSGRTEIWPIAWDLFTDRPLLGYGWGASEQLFIEVARSGRLTAIAFTSHSILLAPLIQGGVIGFAFIGSAVVSAFYHRRRVDAWVLAPIVTLLFSGLTEAIVHLPTVATMLLAGCLAAISSSPRWSDDVVRARRPLAYWRNARSGMAGDQRQPVHQRPLRTHS